MLPLCASKLELRHLALPSLALLLVLVTIACGDDGPAAPDDDDPDPSELLAFINNIGLYPDPPQEFRTPVGALVEGDPTRVENGVEICTKQTYEMGTNLDEIVVFHPNTNSLWPGALVQGKDLTNGILSAVSVARAPCTVGCPDLPGMAGEDLSATVIDPDQFTVGGAINGIVEDFIDSGHTLPAAMDFEMKEVESFEQAMLDIGISASWASGDFSNDFSYSTTSQKNTVFIKFVQKYFTASVNDPASPADMFDRSVSPGDLGAYTGNGNPLCFVSAVTYGRIGLLSVTSSRTRTEVVNAMEVAMKNLKGGGALEIDFASLAVLIQSEIKLKIIGGRPTSGVINLENPVAGLLDWIGGGMNMNSGSRGAPISYTVRYLRDNRLARFQYTTDFAIESCAWADQRAVVEIDKMKCTDGEGGTCPALECEYDFKVEVMIPDGSTATTDIVKGRRNDFDDGETEDFSNANAVFYLPLQRGTKFRLKLGMTEKDDDKLRCSPDSDRSMTSYSRWFEWPGFQDLDPSGTYKTTCSGGGGSVDVTWALTLD